MIRHTIGTQAAVIDRAVARRERIVMADQQAGEGRPFVGVHMKCCNIYIRAYVNAAQDAFVGWCPRCAKQVRVTIVTDPDQASTDRFFEAS